MTTYEITLTFEHDLDHDDAQGDELALVMDDIREQLRDVKVTTVSPIKMGKLMVVIDDGFREVAPCPWDTNDDGDCGRPLCPQCGDPTGRRRR